MSHERKQNAFIASFDLVAKLKIDICSILLGSRVLTNEYVHNGSMLFHSRPVSPESLRSVYGRILEGIREHVVIRLYRCFEGSMHRITNMRYGPMEVNE